MNTNWYGTYEDQAHTLNELVLKRFKIAAAIKTKGYIDKFGKDRRSRIIDLTKSIFMARKWLNTKFKNRL